MQLFDRSDMSDLNGMGSINILIARKIFHYTFILSSVLCPLNYLHIINSSQQIRRHEMGALLNQLLPSLGLGSTLRLGARSVSTFAP